MRNCLKASRIYIFSNATTLAINLSLFFLVSSSLQLKTQELYYN